MKAWFVFQYSPLFLRGDYSQMGTGAGIYSFVRGFGRVIDVASFRVVPDTMVSF